jgi:signal transduction histidine kinase
VPTLVGVGLATLTYYLRGYVLGSSFLTAVVALVVLTGTEVVRFRSEKAAEMRRGLEEGHRRRASEERLRIARELHDVLAHNISMINVQAGVALHLMGPAARARRGGHGACRAGGDQRGQQRRPSPRCGR